MEDLPFSLSFYGASGTVTGSKYLLRAAGRQILLDAGLFQGIKELRLRNWAQPPFDPEKIDAVVLSHAHIDHSGYLPLLARKEFRGKIYCTSGTQDLLKILLPDAAHLQEEEAAFANRRGYSKHKPAYPLYGLKDVERALEQVEPQPYEKIFTIADGIKGLFRRAGHILGSAIVEIQISRPGSDLPFKIVFSGDLGRWGQPILRDPELVSEADVLLIESTYGDRLHPSNPLERLVQVINETADRQGILLVPAFAVGRTQELIWLIRQLEQQKKIPQLSVYVDSPMAINASEVYCRHPEDHDLEMNQLKDRPGLPFASHKFHLIQSVEESKKLNDLKGPAIILSASGMATGGRILHHLSFRLPDPRNTVLLAGFQAPGTRGRSLQDGAKTLRMFGQEIPVAAKIETVDGLSAHADREEIFRWLAGFKKPPTRTFIVHGEPRASNALAEAIHNRLGWKVTIAEDGKTVELFY